MSSNRNRNVFLLGYDDFHASYLRHIARVEDVEFHPLLNSDEVVYQESYDIENLLDRARQTLDDFDGPVDAIITHWDFPAIPMLAILCEERGLPGPSLAAVMKCSHKYWSRLEQHKAAPEATPDFCAVNPFDENAIDKLTVAYPFWIKPVTAYSSALGFRIDDDGDFERAMAEVREQIGRLGDPVNELLKKLDLPPEVQGIDGKHMIAEELVAGKELAPEGYVLHGRVHTHGLIDVVRGENGKSIEQIAYPSTAPEEVGQRAVAVTEKVMRQIGFDNGCFNMEFFWDKDHDRLAIVEINPRVSQSHSNLFEKVGGTSNHAVAVHVALGEEPTFDNEAGEYRQAAKMYWRRYSTADAVVTRVPEKQDLEAFWQRQPDTRVEIEVEAGQRLSELLDQDPYSYVLAEFHIGARDTRELEEKFREAQAMLPFEFRELEADEAAGGEDPHA